jgi:L-threonylcarbamoyladenylate synthase
MARAGEILRAGGLVVFPTDTFYGLAADPRSADAIARVFAAKGRSATTALPLIAADIDQVRAAASQLSALTIKLAQVFWPGPLALVADASPSIAAAVHGGAGTIAIRVPDHVAARQLASCAGFPVVATSANRSGEPAVTSASAVVETIGALVDLVLDAGPTSGGSPSTIVDARGDAPALIRSGAIPFPRVVEAS